MNVCLLMLACSSPTPPDVEADPTVAPAAPDTVAPAAPESEATGPLVLRLRGEEVQIGSQVVEGLPGPDPAGVVEALASLVRASAAEAVIIDAPAEARWLHVRQVAISAREGGATSLYWRLGQLTVGPTVPEERSSGRLAGACRGERLPVIGVDRRYTVNLEANAEVSWARASVTFRPVVDDGEPTPFEGLEPACWQAASCDALLEGPGARDACDAATSGSEPGRARVAVGGSSGCLAPLWKGTRPAAWTIGEALTGVGAKEHDVQLVPEARVTWDVVHATLVNLDETLGMPHLPLSLLQGNDGPPVCDAPARSTPDVLRAAGSWVGGQLVEGSSLGRRDHAHPPEATAGEDTPSAGETE